MNTMYAKLTAVARRKAELSAPVHAERQRAAATGRHAGEKAAQLQVNITLENNL